MRTEDLLDAIGGVDDELLERSEKVKIKKPNTWKKWVPLAACLCLVLGLRFLVFPGGFGMGSSKDDAATENMMSDGASIPMEDSEDVTNAGSDSCDGKEVLENIYVLTMAEDNEDLYATRQVKISETSDDQLIHIEDSYTIFNAEEENVTVEFMYMYNLDHNGTTPVFEDEDGKVVGKAGSVIEITIPANGQMTLKGRYTKTMSMDVEITDFNVIGSEYTNLDIRESKVTFNKD